MSDKNDSHHATQHDTPRANAMRSRVSVSFEDLVEAIEELEIELAEEKARHVLTFEKLTNAALSQRSETQRREWITCPATGQTCKDYCDPGKGDRCAVDGGTTPLFAPSAIAPSISAGGAHDIRLYGTPGIVGTVMGIQCYADPEIPDHTIVIKDEFGRELGRIINVG